MTWIRRWLARVRRAERDRRPADEKGKAGGKAALTGPVFRRVRREGTIGTEPLNANSVVLILDRAAKRAGLTRKFSGHSGRVGAAQDLDAAGFTTLQIQGAGGLENAGAALSGAMAQLARRRNQAKVQFVSLDRRPVNRAGYIEGLINGVEFKQTAYALDRTSRRAALDRFIAQSTVAQEENERLAA